MQQALGQPFCIPGARAILTSESQSGRATGRKSRMIDRIEAGELAGMTLHSRLDDNRFIDRLKCSKRSRIPFTGHYREPLRIEAELGFSPAGLVYPDYPAAAGDPPPLERYDCLHAILAPQIATACAILLGRDERGHFGTLQPNIILTGALQGARSAAADHADAIVAVAGRAPARSASLSILQLWRSLWS